jgi:tetrahydromethanopterin S-methyltransferase subunit A
VCGADGKQAIGHLPGQSFLSLVKNGLDEQGNIIGAQGKRPVIQNVSQRAVEHFRRNVEVLDMIGSEDIKAILEKTQECIASAPGLAETFEEETSDTPVENIQGYLHDKMTLDPCGYFVIYVDRERKLLVMEHYGNKGALNFIIEGATGPELYFPAIDRGLISRLDHAAYLGRELDRAELALKTGLEYVQDTKI